MSSARMGQKWADVDEDDEEEEIALPGQKSTGTRFETAPDKDGIKTVIEYTEKNGQTYKVTRKVKVTTIVKRTNGDINERKNMKKFGKPALNGEKAEAQMVIRSEEEIPIELSKKNMVVMTTKDDAEDKFLEESLNICESLFKVKKAWTAGNREKTEERETSATAPADSKAAETTPATTAEAAPAAPGQPGRYVPPSLRGKGGDGKGDGKGEGKGPPDQEASLRITNLSEDVREGDLQDLFAQCGRLQRVYLAKDPATGIGRGFAFVTYYTREDAQKAINKLNGHGYDNLILQVQFAKPRT